MRTVSLLFILLLQFEPGQAAPNACSRAFDVSTALRLITVLVERRVLTDQDLSQMIKSESPINPLLSKESSPSIVNYRTAFEREIERLPSWQSLRESLGVLKARLDRAREGEARDRELTKNNFVPKNLGVQDIPDGAYDARTVAVLDRSFVGGNESFVWFQQREKVVKRFLATKDSDGKVETVGMSSEVKTMTTFRLGDDQTSIVATRDELRVIEWDSRGRGSEKSNYHLPLQDVVAIQVLEIAQSGRVKLAAGSDGGRAMTLLTWRPGEDMKIIESWDRNDLGGMFDRALDVVDGSMVPATEASGRTGFIGFSSGAISLADFTHLKSPFDRGPLGLNGFVPRKWNLNLAADSNLVPLKRKAAYSFAAVAADRELKVVDWDPAWSRPKIESLQMPPTNQLAGPVWSRDGMQVLIGNVGNDGITRIDVPVSGKPERVGHIVKRLDWNVSSIAVAEVGGRIFVAFQASRNLIRLVDWTLPEQPIIHDLELAQEGRHRLSLYNMPDGTLVLSALSGSGQIWRTQVLDKD